MKKGLDSIKTNVKNLEENIKLKEKYENNVVNIDFSFFYFPSISLKYFNNCFKDEESYNKFMMNFYHQTLNYLKDRTYNELESNNKHTHNIKDDKQVRIINKILDEYTKKFTSLPCINIEMRQEFYQIASLSGARIIGIRYGKTFYVLFFDPYHLIYPNAKYNVDKTSYKSENIFYINDNIKIFCLEHLLENERCIDCEVMDNLIKK